MSAQVFVGNLPNHASKESLHSLFERGGHHVRRTSLAIDRFTGRPRGFGFVEMECAEDAETAVQDMNGVVFGGRQLTVNSVVVPARPSSLHATPRAAKLSR